MSSNTTPSGPIRICHVLFMDCIGGAEVNVRNLCSFSRHINDVCFLGKKYSQISKQLERIGVKLYFLDMERGWDIRRIPSLLKIFKNYDVIHEHIGTRWLPFLLHSFYPGKLLKTHHGPESNPNRNLFHLRLSKDIPICHIAVSNSVKNLLQKRIGICDEKITVIPHGIDIPPRCPVNRKSEKPKRIRSLCRLTRAKNLFFAINIVKLLRKYVPEVVYEIYGSGPLHDELERYIQQIGAMDYIFLKGTTEQPMQVIKGTDILLMPSLHESFGMTLLEAIAEGVPVICSDIEAFKEIAISPISRVHGWKAETYCDRLREVISSPDLAFSMIQKNFQHISAYYDIKTVTECYDNLVGQIITLRKSRL